MKISRRNFLGTVGVATGSMAFASSSTFDIANSQTPETATPASVPPQTVPFELVINGKRHRFSLDPRVTLLDLLRENLHLTGSKKGCDHGQCGACTVLANGRRINSCLSLAVVHQGEEITTVEGLAQGEQLHPVQEAFLEHDGLQCGYCTPGQICSAVALLQEAKRGDASFVTEDLSRVAPVKLSADEVRERMSGNICRCGAYPGIVQAVLSVQAGTISKEGSGE